MKLATQDIELKSVGASSCFYHPNTSYLSTIQILTKAGSMGETLENLGMAHILEHMFFKGSSKYPQAHAISRSANQIGAKMNAYTSYDHTAYYISVLNDAFSEAFDILADMYLHPLFPPHEFQKELKPILSELREQEDDPESLLMEKAFSYYFGDSYHPVIGTEAAIQNASTTAMHQFHEDYYGAQNSLISVVGGVRESVAIQSIERYFSSSAKHVKTMQAPLVSLQGGELRLQKPGIREAYYLRLYPALNYNDPKRSAENMMCYLLGGDDSGLLFERIREDLGLSCYGIYSFLMRSRPFATLGISCGIAPVELSQLEKEIDMQIEKISSELLSLDRFERAKASMLSSIAARAETSAGLTSILSLPILYGMDTNPLQWILEQLEAVTRKDVLEAAQRAFCGPCLRAFLVPES